MNIAKGNFNEEAGESHRGWVVGHFMDDRPMFKTENVEIKWGIQKAGDSKEVMAVNNVSKTLTILVRGKFKIIFEKESIILEKEGDYCFWDAGVAHSWTVEEDTIYITVRWPSVPDDQKPV